MLISLLGFDSLQVHHYNYFWQFFVVDVYFLASGKDSGEPLAETTSSEELKIPRH
jgi:hypothetical protein